MIKGVVSYAGGKDWGDKTLYSFRLADDSNYYNCGTDVPALAKGQLVEFEATSKGPGKYSVDLSSIKVLKEASTEVVSPSRGGFRKPWAGKQDSAKDAYWTRKEERDITTQSVIQLQSSRNSAIAAATLILANGGLDLEKVKLSKKKEAIEELIDGLTERYESQANAKRSGNSDSVVDGAEQSPSPVTAEVNEDEWK